LPSDFDFSTTGALYEELAPDSVDTLISDGGLSERTWLFTLAAASEFVWTSDVADGTDAELLFDFSVGESSKATDPDVEIADFACFSRPAPSFLFQANANAVDVSEDTTLDLVQSGPNCVQLLAGVSIFSADTAGALQLSVSSVTTFFSDSIAATFFSSLSQLLSSLSSKSMSSSSSSTDLASVPTTSSSVLF